VWLLAVGLAVLLLAAGMAAAGAASVTRHRAEAAADFAALAAAAQALSGAPVACARAATVATANGAKLTACRLDYYDAIVTVRLAMPGPLARFGSATATSRAGPA
jgi:secretion/DNA translocation related TadE-like protein